MVVSPACGSPLAAGDAPVRRGEDPDALSPVPVACPVPAAVCGPADRGGAAHDLVQSGNCRYCYLPFRKLKHQMSPDVAEALAQAVGQLDDSGHPIGIVWHGGEPLAVGQQKFRALLTPFEALRRAGRIHHYVQTNATLITDTWCGLLAAYDVRVGVSIDGPAALNAERVDLRGKPAFDRILRGIAQLREHGIPFSVISVVGTLGIAMPEELLEFLTALGGHSVGFNIEEIEGVNTDREPPTAGQAEEFWRRTLTWTRSILAPRRSGKSNASPSTSS